MLWDIRRPANQPCRPLGKTLQCGSDSIFVRRRARGETLDAGEASLQGAHEQDMGSRRGVKGPRVGLGLLRGPAAMADGRARRLAVTIRSVRVARC